MSLFEVLWDDKKLDSGYIEATHKWGLPGVSCPGCRDTWGAVGSEYPAVDLSFLSNESDYRVNRPVSLNEFKALRAPLVRLVPESAPLGPGTQFGPLVGKAKGKFNDFASVNLWTLLIRSELKAKLETRMKMPPTVRPELTWLGDPTDLLELQLEQHGNIKYADPFEFSCQACG
jgi:uncharacterized double-CXXCG motif protein